jgi:hypothetical protein
MKEASLEELQYLLEYKSLSAISTKCSIFDLSEASLYFVVILQGWLRRHKKFRPSVRPRVHLFTSRRLA